MSVVDDIAAAIQKMEGWTPGSVSQRNNNPGNLRAGPGQTGTDATGYAIFPDYATGDAALKNQINLNIGRGLTLTEFFAGKPSVYPGYAPSADSNNPLQYAAFVSSQTGIPMDIPLNNVAGNLPATGGSSNVGDSGVSDFSSVSNVVTGADISSALDMGSFSLYDASGNFSPSPMVIVVAVLGTVALFVGMR
jgi:hypothetical protein